MTTGSQAQAGMAVGEIQASDDLQVLILKELQRVNSRLDEVEGKVDRSQQQGSSAKDLRKLSRPVQSCTSGNSKKCHKSSFKRLMSDSSSDDDEVPCLSVLRTSMDVQRKVDDRIAEIEGASKIGGNDRQKIKSKRGGGVEVLVSKKVAWPHDTILGGPSKQRVTYDQLSITQFVQGFTRNVLDEPDHEIREKNAMVFE